MPAKLPYSYSTKNFHRFGVEKGANVVNEVYVPRVHMLKPVAEVEVLITWDNQPIVAEKVRVK